MISNYVYPESSTRRISDRAARSTPDTIFASFLRIFVFRIPILTSKLDERPFPRLCLPTAVETTNGSSGTDILANALVSSKQLVN